MVIKKLATILIISLFTVSCATVKDDSPGGTVGPGGDEGSDNNGLIIGVIALFALGWSAYSNKKNIDHEGRNTNTLPVLKVEKRTDSKENFKSVGYVLFLTKATGDDIVRHTKFCKDLFNRISYRSSRVDNTSDYRPTIWPIKNIYFNGNTNCNYLLENYDHDFKDEILIEYSFPNGGGPLLVAFNGRYKKGMNKDKDNVGIYWDMTKYNTHEFKRNIEIWYKIMSAETSDWPRLIKELNKKENYKNMLGFLS